MSRILSAHFPVRQGYFARHLLFLVHLHVQTPSSLSGPSAQRPTSYGLMDLPRLIFDRVTDSYSLRLVLIIYISDLSDIVLISRHEPSVNPLRNIQLP